LPTCMDYMDTPITLSRNKAVHDAKNSGCDVLLMIDSDQYIDCEEDGKPFWDTSFDFLYNHYDKGPVCIMAPYGGPPPFESVYIFHWWAAESECADQKYRLEMVDRNHAAMLTGIQECAAGPTGVSLWDMRCFDLMERPYFEYEWKDDWCDEKASTEDVYATRNLSWAGLEKLGYNPVFANWDAWAGHMKPKLVRKPRVPTASSVHAGLRKAVLENREFIHTAKLPDESDRRSEVLRALREGTMKPHKAEFVAPTEIIKGEMRILEDGAFGQAVTGLARNGK
jgi:hypothetical protein